MARKSSGPWWNAAKQAYFVQHGGKQHNLGADHAEALLRWATLTGTPATGSGTLATALEAFVNSRDVAESSRRVMRKYADLIAARGGAVALGRLTVADVRQLVGVASWSHSTRQYALWLIKSACKAAGRPLAIRVSKKQSRGERAVIDDATRAALRAIPGALGRACAVLDDTGCRPGELCAVTAADVDPVRGCWVLREHKTAHATGRPRLVYLTPATLKVSLQLSVKHPAGPLFRSETGRPWTPNLLHKNTVAACERLELPHVFPYAWRHTFATRLLKADVSPAKVAALMGHVGLGTLFANYAHLLSDDANMRDALRRLE